MDVYRESNTENIDYFYPGQPRTDGLREKIEANFLHFIETDFLTKPGNSYWVLEEDGVWVSALRLYTVQDRFFYMEALETRPDARRRGYAAKLMGGVMEALKQGGPFRLCDSVHKTNEASLNAHRKCGFVIASDAAVDYLTGTVNEREFGMELVFEG